MQRILLFIFIFYGSIVSAQLPMIPHLEVEKGQIHLLNQNQEINVVGTAADVRLYQIFKVDSAKTGAYLYPIDLETSLYDLTVYYSDKIISLESKNMDNIRKQVLAENKKRKQITLSHSTEQNYLRLELEDIPDGEEIKVVVKYMANLNESGNLKSLRINPLIIDDYTNDLNEIQFKINIISPTPITSADVNSHKTTNEKLSEKYRSFTYQGKDWGKPVELSYSSRGDRAEAGMLVYEDKGCRYILGVVEPPKKILPEMIAPREYVFVMDISGSMQGFPIETSKELVKRILNDLKPEEKFNILFFSGGSDFFSNESVYATSENKDLAIQMINNQKGVGETKLSEALNKVYQYKPDKQYNRVVVLVTDGKLNENRMIYSEMKKHLADAQYFCFGIGYDVDRKNIQTLAMTAGTESVLITEQHEAQKELDKFFNLIRTPLLRHIEVSSRELNLSETYPSQFNGFLSSESSSFVSKECSGLRTPELILSGINGEENYNETFHLPNEKNNDHLRILEYLWAREKIDFLLAEEERCGERCIRDGKYRNQIIKIGEELNIATPYTSFIRESYNNNNGSKGKKKSLYENPKNHLTFQNDFDSDFDKLPNINDECPFDRGGNDRKGCPKTREEKVAKELNRMLEGIEFDFDSYEIKPEFYEKLDIAASIISNQPEQEYIVEGHTDAAGTPEYNINLSLNRAKAVVEYLKKKGVDISQLTVVGKGDTELKHPECRPQEICDDQKNFENRRVVFKLKG